MSRKDVICLWLVACHLAFEICILCSKPLGACYSLLVSHLKICVATFPILLLLFYALCQLNQSRLSKSE